MMNIGPCTRTVIFFAILTLAACMSTPGMAAPVALPQPPPNTTLPDKPPGAHWVWVGDYQGGNYGRSVLYDADSASILGMIDTGWEGGRLLWRNNEIYNAAMFMSRGFRGQRTDVVTTFDSRTLTPLREVVVPPKTIRGFQDMNHFSLTDDGRFMLLQLMSPASSIGVVDLQANKFVGEIETAGCINAMPAGNRRVFAMCGDGSLLTIDLTDDGKEAARKRLPKFFDPDSDPLHESGVRSGNTWYFVSHLGLIHPVDVSGADFKPAAKWSISQSEGESTWIPAQPMQNLSVHNRQRKLYVLVYPSDLKPKMSGSDIHRRPGTEVWVYDLKTHRRVQRIALKNLVDAIAVSQDEHPLLYASSLYHLAFTILDAATGKLLHEIPFPSYPNIVQPVE